MHLNEFLKCSALFQLAIVAVQVFLQSLVTALVRLDTAPKLLRVPIIVDKVSSFSLINEELSDMNIIKYFYIKSKIISSTIPEKSPSDSRDYKIITLSNQLECILVSDRKLTKLVRTCINIIFLFISILISLFCQ